MMKKEMLRGYEEDDGDFHIFNFLLRSFAFFLGLKGPFVYGEMIIYS